MPCWLLTKPPTLPVLCALLRRWPRHGWPESNPGSVFDASCRHRTAALAGEAPSRRLNRGTLIGVQPAMPTFSPQALHALTLLIARRMGSAEDEAQEVADHLVRANLVGHDSHGVGMLPAYVRLLQEIGRAHV